MSNPAKGRSRRREAGVYLPPELFPDILSRLSVKSVGRFRCVCKQWRTLLSDQKFPKLHFSNRRNKSEKKFITMYSRSEDTKILSLLTIDFFKDSNSTARNVVASGKAINSEFSGKLLYKLYGSCNGLVLVGCGKYRAESELLFIRNPITGESRELPVLPRCLCCTGESGDRVDNYYGLGYDSTHDDYKVVLFRVKRCGNTCFVYTLKRNCWKKVQNPPFGGYGLRFGASVDDANRWNAYWISLTRKSIFAFDFTDETFREVERPPGLKEDDVYDRVVIGGCPCLVNRFGRPNSEVWVMRENSWTKYLVPPLVRYPLFLTNNLWFLWNDIELMVETPTGKHMLYNLKSGISRELETRGEGLPQCFDCFSVHGFAESLFSPNCSNAIEDQNQAQ